MKSLILYDSYFGNTKVIAKAIAESLGGDTKFKRVDEFNKEDLDNLDLLIVGSPTRAFSFSDRTMTFLAKIPVTGLKDIKVTTFDTRIDSKTVKPKILGFLMDKFGYANKKIIKVLKGKGGEIILEPEGFFVVDKEGPLKGGEEDRAKKWTSTLRNLR